MNKEEFTRTLIIYQKDSYYRYYDLYLDNLYEIDSNNNLKIYNRCRTSGKETLRACFKTWDYFVIE